MKWWMWFLYVPGMLIAFIIINQYFFCAQYRFIATPPFSGSRIYNPYEKDDSAHWRKCNFHAHTYAWGGLTNGKGTEADVWNIYNSLGYDVHCISNYESISTYHSNDPGYVPAYEHGYGMRKNHQGVLGADKVTWSDYLLPQTQSNKQHILSKLNASDSTVIIINHPGLRDAYSPADMSLLSGYDCIEGFAHGNNSFAVWDAALSAGKPVFIVASDDVHNVANPNEVAINCTWVFAQNPDKSAILHALKSGNAYAMKIGNPDGATLEKKILKAKMGYPMIQRIAVENDSLKIDLDQPASQFQFIGQDGNILASQQHGTSASYPIQPGDTYVRVQISFDDGTEICLNPIFRDSGTFPLVKLPETDETKTIFFRLLGAGLLAAIGFIPFASRLRKGLRSN